MNNNDYIYKQLEKTKYTIIPILEEKNENDKLFIRNLFEYAKNNWKNSNKIDELIIFAHRNNYLNYLLKDNTYLEYLLQNCSMLLQFKHISKKNINAYQKIINKIKEDEKNYILQIITNELNFYKLNNKSNKYDFNILREIIFLIIKEISENEHTKMHKIELIGHGDFSSVYCLGNKIIKIGRTRLTKKFPNNPYIIKPLLRKEFEIGENNSFFIEVCEKIKTNCCSEEDVYELYKKLRDIGLIWMDPKISNIGKLIKDNKIYWNKKLNPSDKALSLSKYKGNESLKKGNIIICDADSIYEENDPKICIQRVYRYENRYKENK